MAIDLMFPNGTQMQSLVDKPSTLEPKKDVLEVKIAPKVQIETLVSNGTVELGDPLVSRNRIILKNLSPIRTARIGGSGISEKIGYLLEPLHELTILFDPAVAISIYGRAVGAELKVEVMES